MLLCFGDGVVVVVAVVVAVVVCNGDEKFESKIKFRIISTCGNQSTVGP